MYERFMKNLELFFENAKWKFDIERDLRELRYS